MDKSQPSHQSMQASAIQELEAFTYSVSHDLRAPLQYITGFIDLLKKHLEQTANTDQKIRRYVQVIHESSDRLAKMLDGLLDLSRIGREQKKEMVPLQQVVDALLKDVEIKTKERNINWKIHSLPPVQGDPFMLKSALLELIENAIKFTRPQKNAVIEIGERSNSEEDRVFFVRDNGVGFDRAYVDKLFGPFQRLHKSAEFEGMGLGLAKVRKIIRLHGGKTWAEGEKNKGATFYFSFPGSREKVG